MNWNALLLFGSALSTGCCLLLLALGGACAGRPTTQQRAVDHLLDDKVTQARVEAALQQGGSNSLGGVKVTVSNGTAYLTGTVASPAQRQQAEQLAESVRRAKRVENQVQVAH